jgi:hypothetical protein
MALEFFLLFLGFDNFLLLRDEQNSKCVCVCGGGGGVGGHKIHISTTNIPKFHSRYRREVFITNEFHEFCRFTISGTSNDGKASYGPKSMHIFIMSKIRHSHKQYDMRGCCGTKPGPNQAKVGPASPTSLTGRPGFGVFLETVSYTCQGRSVM